MASTDLSNLVRDMWLRTLGRGLLLRIPVLSRMLELRRMSWEGGENITRTVDKAEGITTAQSYKANTILRQGMTSITMKPKFPWKYFQVPLEFDIDDMVGASGGRDTNVTGQKFVTRLTKRGQKIARLKMLNMMYAAGVTGCDTEEDFHSIPDALTHDVTYGTLARATTVTNRDWQGGSIDQTYADQATARGMTIDTVQQATDAIRINADDGMDKLMCVVGTTNFRMVRSQVEAQRTYKEGPTAKYGHSSLMIDEVEVVQDPFLENAAYNANYATTKKYLLVLNLADWEMRLHPQRSFKITNFVNQAQFMGGMDKWLARVMTAGDLVCWRPAGSILLTNVWSGA